MGLKDFLHVEKNKHVRHRSKGKKRQQPEKEIEGKVKTE